MYSLLLGMLGFLLFFLYDVNSFTWRSRLLHKSFALGVTLLAAATVLDLAAALRMGAFSGLKDIACFLRCPLQKRIKIQTDRLRYVTAVFMRFAAILVYCVCLGCICFGGWEHCPQPCCAMA